MAVRIQQFTYGWSAQWLADQFKMDRRTVIKKLKEGECPVLKEADGHATYRLKDAAPLLLGIDKGAGAVNDPDKLPPMERRAFYQSENERLKMEVSKQNLVPAAEVERDYAQLVKVVSQFFDTLPDVLERDAGLAPEQVISVQTSCDRVRQSIYEAVTKEEDDVRKRA